MADDGWTQIPSKGKRKTAPQPNANGLNPPARDLTLEALRRDFDTKTKTWKASNCRKTLYSMLNRIKPEGGWQVKKAICLASGSLSRENLECRRRSLWQMVVFVDIVQQYLGEELQCVAQEPMYTDLDKEFLQTLGIKTLDVGASGGGGLGPAKEYLGPETFVYEPFLDMNAAMLREVLEADVLLYIGSSIRGLSEKGGEVGVLAKKFIEGRGMYKFPVFEVDPNVMDGMAVYWKEEKDED